MIDKNRLLILLLGLAIGQCLPSSVLAWSNCSVTLSAEKLNICAGETVHLRGNSTPSGETCKWSSNAISYGTDNCRAKFISSTTGKVWVSVGLVRPRGYRKCSSDALPITVYAADSEFCTLGYFASLEEEEIPEECDKAGNPISPRNGNKFQIETDYKGLSASPIKFQRFYNSKYAPYSQIGKYWQHTFFRELSPIYSEPVKQYDAASPRISTKYASKAEACTSGWGELSAKAGPIPGSGVATPVLENNSCHIYVDGKYWRSVTLFATQPTQETSTIIGWKMQRPGGFLQRFEGTSGVLTKSPKTKSSLEVTATGFKYTDANDNVEIYDQNGKLLSITDTRGNSQTLSYNAQGLLDTVSKRVQSLASCSL